MKCTHTHPTLFNACTLEEGHEGGHCLDLGPGNPGVKTEEFLRCKSPLFQETWRRKFKRGMNQMETVALEIMVRAFHGTEDP